MATEWLQTKSRGGFGRGSAVRDYWLERCQGFQVIRADGRSLGRVRRLETKATGTFLRLTGFRSRVFPLSAVETVWPAASLLLVGQPEIHQRSVSGPVDATRPSWADETLPWWELLEDDRSSVEGTDALPPLAVPQRPWQRWQHRFSPGGRGSASPITSFAGKLFTQMRGRCKQLSIVVHRQGQKGWELTRAIVHEIPSWLAAARAAGANTMARGRFALGRLLLHLAVWVAGGRNPLLGTMRPLDALADNEPSRDDGRAGSTQKRS
jgi:hypothetical protein